MKKSALKSVTLLLTCGVVLITSSCKRTETPNEQKNNMIGFSVNIESATNSNPAEMTKIGAVVSKATFANNDSMGLWVVPFSVTGNGSTVNDVYTDLRPVGNYLDNVRHTYSASAFAPATSIFYPNAIAKVDLYAVFPYKASMSALTGNSMTDPKKFNFAIDQNQSAAGGSSIVKNDLMTAFYRGAKQGANGTLSFRHRMSRVLVAFTVAEKYKEKAVIAVKSVVLCGVPLKSLVNITDTAVAPSIDPTTNSPVDVTAYQAIKPDGVAVAGNYTYEAIVTPGAEVAADGVLVKVTLQVQDLGDVEFMCKTKNLVTYEAQKQTNITVNIMDQSTISFANVAIQGWGTPFEISAGTSKLSNMVIKCQADAGASINKTATTAKLTIQNEVFDATATYDEALSGYRLRYDHKDNFGGYLTKIEMKDVAAQAIFTSATLPAAGLQIKGDPTVDGYSTPIGTMTFKADGSVAIN